jgi:excisionase family DNA binding protein
VAITTITIDGDAQVITSNATPVPTSHELAAQPLAYTIEAAVEATGIGDSKLRRYIQSGELVARRNGRSLIIRREDLIAFLQSLPVARTEG